MRGLFHAVPVLYRCHYGRRLCDRRCRALCVRASGSVFSADERPAAERRRVYDVRGAARKLGAHLRKPPMGYFTAGNIGKISSVLTTDMIFVEEIAMSSIANMMSYAFSATLMAYFFLPDVRLGIIGLLVTVTAMITAGKMNRISMKEAVGRQEQSEKLTDAVLSFTEGIAIIKSYNLLGEKSAELSNNFKLSRDKSLGFEEAMTPWQRGLNLIYACGMALLFGVSVYLQQTGSLTIPYSYGGCSCLCLIYLPAGRRCTARRRGSRS